MAHPLIVDRAQKLPVLRRTHACLGDLPAGGRLPGERRLRGQALDDGDELEVPGARLAQEAVDGQGLLAVDTVDSAEEVVLHPVLLQPAQAAHYCVESWLAAPASAIVVVQAAGAIQAEAHQKLVLAQKRAPLVGEEGAVRLQGVDQALAGRQVAPLQFHDTAEEGEPHQRRLAALPGEADGGHLLRLDVLFDERLQHRVAHAEAARARVEALLLQVEAVSAVQVAGRAGRLGHHMEGARPRAGHASPEALRVPVLSH